MYPHGKPDFTKTDWQEDVDKRLEWGITQGITLGVVNQGDHVVCVQGWRGGQGHTNTIRIVPAERNLGLVET
jgi:pyruvate kinase